MEFMVNIKDPIVRKAIWETYNKRCFYCNEPISRYSTLQIEHIIALAIPIKYPEKYIALKKELGLPVFSK